MSLLALKIGNAHKTLCMKTKTTMLLLAIFMACTFVNAQNDPLIYDTEWDDIDQASFRSMMGFDYHKFRFKAEGSPFVNVYIDEYLNDSLIQSYDHISANLADAPVAYRQMIFHQLDTSEFTLRIYAHSQSDTLERVQFRIGELGLYRRLQVNQQASSYSWKPAYHTADGEVRRPVINEKIPLLYYTTAEQQNVNGETISAFCLVPNILNKRHLVENRGRIRHFFEIGLLLVDKLE